MKEEDLKLQITGILKSSGKERKNLIPLLQEIQREFGYIPPEAMEEIGKFLGIAETTVYGVATFYNQFRFTPPGRHHIKVCLGTACHIKGGNIILEAWERKLNIKEGEVTPDRGFSLERVACVGCCALAPVSMVEDTVEGKETIEGTMMPTRVDGILLSFELEEKKKDKIKGEEE
ncbi:MAG: NADH-quinone oxidoreductase subunit NuoE [Deltaproteobacteria bacterium]|nr:MAG: NADH-quinone oxidoreductase subunit NuoE [Deltaproteobacteria bacterium]